MSIRRKTILIIGATLIGMIVVVYGVSQLIFLNSFVQLEEKTVNGDVQRALNALNDRTDVIVSTNQDWSHWTDDYNFVADPAANDSFRHDNTHDGIFTTYGLNVMLFINSENKIVFEKGFDLNAGQEVPVPDSLSPYILPDGILLKHTDSSGGIDQGPVEGIIMLPEGPMFISSSAILTTELEGPSHGSLIWGRYLNAQEIQNVTDKTRLSVNIYQMNDPQLPADYQNAAAALQGGTNIVTKPLDSQTIAGYTLLNDLFGKPALIFRVDIPRDIYGQGQASVFYFIIALLVVGVIFVGATLILLERIIISRLAFLNREVSDIRISTDLKTRVYASGEDELSSLATTINQMLDALSQAHENLEHHRDQALDALRLKAQIMANVSHDARTPLNIITLRIEMLQHGLYGPVTPQQSETLESIKVNASQLLFFINNLLDQAQLEAGKVKLDRVELRPRELLENLQVSMSPLANKKGLALRTEVDDNVPQALLGDPNRINQILSNLVVNAIKFTDQGSVEVRFLRADNTHWAFRITDTGPGIPLEDQSRIFEAFWQVDGSSTRKVTRGVGLGLSIVSQLTNLMGGHVSVQSKVGVGSTFTVVLPLDTNQGELEDEKVLSVNH